MDKEKIAELKAQAEAVKEWGAADRAAFEQAQDEPVSDGSKTPAEIAQTISAAVKLFFDGKIKDETIRNTIEKNGLNMNDLRTSVVEQTLVRALPNIINAGDIERLAKIGMLGGEKINPASASSNVVVQYVTKDELDAVDSHIDEIIGK